MFRLEHDRGTRATIELVAALAQWLGSPDQAELRRAFEVLIERVLQPGAEPTGAAPTLEETKAMLETKMQQWEREWQERSEAHGRQAGQAALLVRLLERRFGPIDDSVRARIDDAASDDLLVYADRVLDARDIDSVFSG